MLWDKKGVPQKGWRCVGESDLRETRPGGETSVAKCEMCGNTGLRFVHEMTHPEYGRVLSVGRICAAKMTKAYESPRSSIVEPEPALAE
jgi:hypothetical protein